MSFGDRLKKARKAKKLTQDQVAKIVGIDFTTISKYENDHSEPDYETLKRLAQIYEVSIDSLLGKETPAAQELIESLDLSDEELLEKYNFNYKGEDLTPELVKKILSYVRFVVNEEK